MDARPPEWCTRRIIFSIVALLRFVGALELFEECRPRSIVFHSHDDERGVLQPRRIDVSLRVAHSRTTVCKKVPKTVARDEEQTNIDSAFTEGLVQMNHVDHDEVAAGRELHLNSDADFGSIHNFAFRPVQIAGYSLRPAARGHKLGVDHLPYGGSAIAVLLF